jgi:hypothetical protein
MTDDRPRRLHRIVQNNPPAVADFTSKAQLGIPCPVPDPDVQRRWTGLSLFGSDELARRTARRLPMLGSFIAALDIPDGPGMQVEMTPGPGHYLLGGPGGQPSGSGSAADPGPVPGFQYEVWELHSRSLVATSPDEREAASLIRRMVAAGWTTDHLVLGVENEAVDVADLPPALTGAALSDHLAESDGP